MKKFSWKHALLGLCAMSLSLSVTGCGSDNSGIQQALNPFAGNYAGNVPLDGNRLGKLALVVDAAGNAAGTFQVQDVMPRQVLITPGVYNVLGFVDPATGQFRLSGNVPGIGDFVIEGTLPNGLVVLTIDGQTYSGTLQPGTVNNNTNNNNGGTARLVIGGSVPAFTFTPNGSYNGVNPPVDTGSMVGGAVQNSSPDVNSITLSLSETTLNGVTPVIRALAVGIRSPQTLVVGQSYPLLTGQAQEGSFISLSESEGQTVTQAWAPDAQTTGQVTLVRLTDSEVELQFQFSDVGLNSEVQGNTAAGRFSTSGTIVGTLSTL